MTTNDPHYRISAGALFVAFGLWSANADILIDLDATGLAEGPLASITNTGTLGGTFNAEFDVPTVANVGGVNAITLDGTNDWYVGPDATILSGSADRSCEAWVYNPGVIPDEETIIAWGRRGGGEGQNWSMLYGVHPTFGALGAWGAAPDMPFQPGGGAPPSDQWNHLVLTYDGATNTRSIYVDGLLSNSENDGVVFNTHAVDDGTFNIPALPLPFTLGNQNEANGTRTDALSGALSIAKLKVHDVALDAAAIQASFDADKATFGKLAPQIASFTASSTTFETGETVTLFFDVVDGDSLSIDNEVGDVTALTQIEVMPTATTTYTLTATNAEGATTDELTVFLVEAASLIHQWTFDEFGGAGTVLVDSIGDADGTIIDQGNLDGSVALGRVTLTGGAKAAADFVQFPSGLLEGLNAVTMETWATEHSVQNWSRVFSFGSGTGDVTNAWHLSWSRGTDQNTQRLEKQGSPVADANLAVDLDTLYHFVVTWNPGGGINGNGRYEWFRDGVLASGSDTNGVELSSVDDTVLWLGRSQWNDSTANASWEEFRIYDGVLNQQEIEANFAAGPTVAEDTDRDGIPDVVEDEYAFLDSTNPDDALLDQDEDGLNNVGEYENGTDLEVKDTDMDGSEDGAEIARNTDPLDQDTDDDGLLDGVETDTDIFESAIDTGTDPLDPDSDDDGISDGPEVANGSDPNDASSIPNATFPELVHRWAFDETGGAGTVLVDSIGGADGVIEEVGLNDGTVADGKVTLTGGAQADSDFVRLPANLMSVLTDATIETWVTQHSAQNWSRVFSYGSATDNVMHMSFSRGANIDQNELRWNLAGAGGANITLQDFGGAPTNPLEQQVHWVVTIDDDGGAAGETKLTVYKDGQQVATGDTANDLGQTTDNDFFLGRSQWADNGANASWDDFRIYDGVMEPLAVQVSNARGPDAQLGGGIQITDVAYDADNQTLDVTWTSRPGKAYIVWTSEDGITWGDEDDAYDSQGDLTTYTDIDASGERLLVRIEESP